MMLVQTTVAAVIPYFERFLAQFPTVQALAKASEDQVLKAWEGLGYYRRARQLHQAARHVMLEHDGVFPAERSALEALPGVGRYIAGAVLSFAFDQPAAILEANTQRVLARLLAWKGDLTQRASQDRLWQASERLVPGEGAGTFNQALMELGATTCVPNEPLCLVCPLARDCRARALGIEGMLPIKSARLAPLEVSEACALVVRDEEILVVRRGDEGLWAGFWEFPTIHLAGADPAGRALGRAVDLAEGVRLLTGARIRVGAELRRVRFSVTKHRVTLAAFAARPDGGQLAPGPGLAEVTWAATGALADLPFGSAQRKLASWLSSLLSAGNWPNAV
jgi:A/G-specific adenine glycosylase